jgi:hypothetical protein
MTITRQLPAGLREVQLQVEQLLVAIPLAELLLAVLRAEQPVACH